MGGPLGLQAAVFLLCAHMLSLIIKTQIISDQGPTAMTSFNLNYFLRDPISKYNYTGVRTSTHEFGRTEALEEGSV